MNSPLAHQVRVVRMFHALGCFCIGTIEGRVAVRYIEERTDLETVPGGAADKLKNSFSFRCHRHALNIFPVNCIDTHPHPNYQDVFATAGSDGTVVFWNKAKKLKLKEYTQFLEKHTISAMQFNKDGSLCAYAASYDYYRGSEGVAHAPPTQLFVHAMTQVGRGGRRRRRWRRYAHTYNPPLLPRLFPPSRLQEDVQGKL